MKKRLLYIIALVFSGTLVYFSGFHKSKNEKLREKHKAFLENSPFKKTQNLNKKERLKLGLPPNAYYEQRWELTMDPNTGRPMPERAMKIQEGLREERLNQRGGGGDDFSPWIERGPNNIGGRTRGIMIDPNDNTHRRVFSGGVSGGLWVNNDITDSNSSWTLVPGIGANISVTSIISDPNNSNTFYIGSGESYTSGDAIGRGIWKSTDGGVTWSNIFGGPDGTVTNGGQFVNGIFYVNDIIARDVGSTTELYASIAGAFFGDSSSPSNFHGLNQQGLYKSTDNGATWNRISILESDNSPSNPNDLELDLNNNIWLTTTRSSFGNNGGKIFRSTDGNTFTLINTIPNARRTELEPSQINVNTFWVLANVGGQADIFRTTDAFTTFTQINEPNDADAGILATDFTRGQAFYDLVIEADANDRLYVGGIDWFSSPNNGNTWVQISRWNTFGNLGNLSVPVVHADQHAIVFVPDNQNQAIIGNDGGVYYASSLNQSSFMTNTIRPRNTNYNTTQFYYGTIDNTGGSNGDDIAGGTQDNGTPISINSNGNINSFQEPFGGDGGYTEIDDSGQYMIQSFFRNDHRWVNYPSNLTQRTDISTLGPDNAQNGSFINEAELDKSLDILYTNASIGGTFRIERISDFLPGQTRENTFITNGQIDASPSALKISPFTTSSSKLYVGLRNGRLLRIDNANVTPSFSTISGGNFVGSISDIEFGTSEQEIFVTLHNYGVNSVWHTSNGGSSWRNIEGNLPDLPVECILQNPLRTQELIIGTKLGVWRTGDFTATNPVWVQSFNGMSDVPVVDLDLRPTDNTILATTHGRGFFTSTFTSDAASVEDVLTDKKIATVYPTISNGNLTVFGKSDLGLIKVSIFDISGRQVYKTTLNFNNDTRQPVSVNLRSGVYIVNLEGTNNRKSTEKIIIQ